jgi:hypothetical protein
MLFALIFLVIFLIGFISVKIVGKKQYKNLMVKEVTVESLKYIDETKGLDYHNLTTTDGLVYSILGKYNMQEVENVLTKGTTITIKYYESQFEHKMIIEEIIVNQKLFVSFNNYSLNGVELSGIASISCFILSIALLLRAKNMKNTNNFDELDLR